MKRIFLIFSAKNLLFNFLFHFFLFFRPKNWLRIGDRIISVDYSLISELVIDSTHESAKQLFISKNCLDQSNNFKIKPGLLEQSGNFPIFGVIRDKLDAHLMAVSLFLYIKIQFPGVIKS